MENVKFEMSPSNKCCININGNTYESEYQYLWVKREDEYIDLLLKHLCFEYFCNGYAVFNIRDIWNILDEKPKHLTQSQLNMLLHQK